MNRWKIAFAKLPIVCVSAAALGLALCLTGCGGGGNAGGGGGGGGGSVGPTSGEYLLEPTSQMSLSYATINSTTGALGPLTVAGDPVFSDTNYPNVLVSPSGNFLYAIYSVQDLLETFQLSGPGVRIMERSGSEFSIMLPYEWSMTLHPSGKFLYVIQTGIIQELSVNTSDGSLTPGPMLTIDGDIRTGIFDPAGDHLFVNDLTRGRIFAYNVDQSDGSLTPVANSPFTLPSGEQPSYIAMGGSGTSLFLYADIYSTNQYSTNGIAALSINSSTGALTLVPGSPFQSTSDAPDNISVDPSGRFLYASAAEDGSIDGYSINPTTGALELVPGSPFATAPTSGTIAIDPSGKFLYVTNYSNSTIYGFSLDAETGTLSPIAGSPFPSVPQPEGLTIMNVP